MKKIAVLLLTVLLCFTFCACGTVEDTTIDSESEAIAAVKGDNGPMGTESRIASGLGLMYYQPANYGVCYAEQKDDGSWSVTLMGNMYGFTNATKTDFDFCGFSYTTTITRDGKISYGKTQKIDD